MVGCSGVRGVRVLGAGTSLKSWMVVRGTRSFSGLRKALRRLSGLGV